MGGPAGRAARPAADAVPPSWSGRGPGVLGRGPTGAARRRSRGRRGRRRPGRSRPGRARRRRSRHDGQQAERTGHERGLPASAAAGVSWCCSTTGPPGRRCPRALGVEAATMTTRPNMIGEADAVLVTVAAPTKPRPAVGTSSPSMAPHPVRGRHPGWRPTACRKRGDLREPVRRVGVEPDNPLAGSRVIRWPPQLVLCWSRPVPHDADHVRRGPLSGHVRP